MAATSRTWFRFWWIATLCTTVGSVLPDGQASNTTGIVTVLDPRVATLKSCCTAIATMGRWSMSVPILVFTPPNALSKATLLAACEEDALQGHPVGDLPLDVQELTVAGQIPGLQGSIVQQVSDLHEALSRSPFGRSLWVNASRVPCDPFFHGINAFEGEQLMTIRSSGGQGFRALELP